MSGGSHDYMFSQVPDDLREAARRVAEMAKALDRNGFPFVAARTVRLANNIAAQAEECDALASLWHAQEWHQSGDWARYDVRREAAKLGEPVPACGHAEKRPAYGWRSGQVSGPSARFLVCEECGDEFDDPQPPAGAGREQGR